MFWKYGHMEIIISEDQVIMRDSDFPEQRVTCTPKEWEEFIRGAKAGEFNLED